MKNLEKFKKIIAKYSNKKYNKNYNIGGGLSVDKFASNRHEDAKADDGKLTIGAATKLFKTASGLEIDVVKEIINYAVPNMEWHHAGKLPKSYGGGMKKTYFLNASEIYDVAKNWDVYVEKLNLSKIEAKNIAEIKRTLETRRLEFLQVNAKKVVRIIIRPSFFYLTEREMNGKYGWFDSTYKLYNLTEYFSGWAFESEAKYNEFLTIK